ncbi:MAG: transporter [Clostridiales bacterium]|nr:transporter [Clostridiales bacterium]
MLNLSRRQTSMFLILIAIIIVLSGNLFLKDMGRHPAKLDDTTDGGHNLNDIFEDEDRANTTDIAENIKIYIIGQVHSPGVIELKEGSRLIDAIELAGGMLNDADRDRVNLALRVQDEGMYKIPKIGEEIEEEIIQIDTSGLGDISKVDINRASLEQLQTLHGIGPAKAKAIIDYRENNGSFRVIDDITKVTGIGAKTFEQIKDSITVR